MMASNASTTAAPQPVVLGVGTLVGFLFGRAESIRTVATAKSSIWIGLAFVMSAAFAREYDGEDLLAEPWHLFFPLIVSTIAAFLLAGVACVYRTEGRLPFGRIFPIIMCSVWFMAPMAWLYAIPYEQFLTPPDATRANLATLALVSLWRVLLAIRVLNVLFRLHPARAACVVVFSVSLITIALTVPTSAEVVASMGGVFGPEAERFRREAFGAICCLSPVALILSFWAASALPLCFPDLPFALPNRPRSSQITRPLLFIAMSSIAIWAIVLPFTLPAQHRRCIAEELSRERDAVEVVKFLSAHRRSDFPFRWRPVPRFPPNSPHVFVDCEQTSTVLEAIRDAPASEWVREHYLNEMRAALDSPRVRLHPQDKISQVLEVLATMPDTDDIQASLAVLEKEDR